MHVAPVTRASHSGPHVARNAGPRNLHAAPSARRLARATRPHAARRGQGVVEALMSPDSARDGEDGGAGFQDMPAGRGLGGVLLAAAPLPFALPLLFGGWGGGGGGDGGDGGSGGGGGGDGAQEVMALAEASADEEGEAADAEDEDEEDDDEEGEENEVGEGEEEEGEM